MFFEKKSKIGAIRPIFCQFCFKLCGHFELSKNSIGGVVFQSRNVNSVDTIFTTERHFGWEIWLPCCDRIHQIDYQ